MVLIDVEILSSYFVIHINRKHHHCAFKIKMTISMSLKPLKPLTPMSDDHVCANIK